MAVKIMDPVVIVDPTTWTDALKIGVIMSVIIAFVFIVLYGKASSLVKALALVLAMCAIGGIGFPSLSVKRMSKTITRVSSCKSMA